MNAEAWIALAERCEAASGPDRELDYWLMTRSVRPGQAYLWDPQGSGHRYTASVDLILALIGETLPGWSWERRGGTMYLIPPFVRGEEPDEICGMSASEVPALELASAYCRARATESTRAQAMEGSHG